ncbi:MAG: hypothetical protein HY313_06980 [Acidobacteria bacterium]|nr:hypothetical protein [Acidobacteriota bacterium]
MFYLKGIGSVLVLGIAMVAGTMLASAADQALEGIVTDASCGLTHKMADAKRCTNACARTGGYALVVGDKVYKLEGKTEGLADLAAEKAKVTGTVDGMKITVTSVAKAS